MAYHLKKQSYKITINVDFFLILWEMYIAINMNHLFISLDTEENAIYCLLNIYILFS